MTEQTSCTARVEAAPDSRLHQLLFEYADAQAKAQEAAERFDAVKTAIKAELGSMAPGSKRIALSSPQLNTSLLMRYVESWRVDAKRLKAEDPESYVRYAVKGGRWELRSL